MILIKALKTVIIYLLHVFYEFKKRNVIELPTKSHTNPDVEIPQVECVS